MVGHRVGEKHVERFQRRLSHSGSSCYARVDHKLRMESVDEGRGAECGVHFAYAAFAYCHRMSSEESGIVCRIAYGHFGNVGEQREQQAQFLVHGNDYGCFHFADCVWLWMPAASAGL